MLKFYSATTLGEVDADLTSGTMPQGVDWIDALHPTEAEVAFLERALGVAVPNLAKLSEIENSSRLSSDAAHLFLSFPAVFRDGDGTPRTTPVGFVLSSDRLMTVRFEPLKFFEVLGKRLAARKEAMEGGLGVFIAILENIIDHVADVLEQVGADLDKVSRHIFGWDAAKARAPRPRQDNADLRATLRQVGRSGDLTGKISESLLGMGRMIPYVASNAGRHLSSETKERLDSLKQDVTSLNEYETHLTDKTQFLLDTTLGLANIDQNNVFRVLTVVSVIGIPPTFIASMYGMNFKNMPEYDWSWGYQYGLALILLSAVVPMLWFKWRGWW